MTQLQIIDFQKRWGLSSHLGGVFSVDLTLERQFNIIIDNFVPLLYRELSKLTFLQRSHLIPSINESIWQESNTALKIRK